MKLRISVVAWWLMFATAVMVAIVIRLRFLSLPLERDEGEYAYVGQLMLRGLSPYVHAYTMKFPGTHAAYALIMLAFGQTASAIHLGLLLVNIATVALIAVLGVKLYDHAAGAAAGAAYAILSLGKPVFGLAAHATHFVMLPALVGLVLILKPSGERNIARLLLAGICFGLAILAKQPALWFALFGAAYVVHNTRRGGQSGVAAATSGLVFGSGVVIPLAITALVLAFGGAWTKAVFWTVSYAREYAQVATWSDAAVAFRATSLPLLIYGGAIYLFAVVGLLTAGTTKSRAVVLLGFLTASVFALSVGFYFRGHYFVLLLPAVALFAGAGGSALTGRLTRAPLVGPALFAIVLAVPVLLGREMFFTGSPDDACRIYYGDNPFLESVRVAKFIGDNTSSDDRVAVLGSEPQINFYARRLSPSGYLYMYGLMEPQKFATSMQSELISEVEAGRPKIIVAVTTFWSWLPRATSDLRIRQWLSNYCDEKYDLIGVVEIDLEKGDRYLLPYHGERDVDLTNAILIFERKA